VLNVHLSCNTVLVWFIGTLYMCSCCGIYVMYVRQEACCTSGPHFGCRQQRPQFFCKSSATAGMADRGQKQT